MDPLAVSLGPRPPPPPVSDEGPPRAGLGRKRIDVVLVSRPLQGRPPRRSSGPFLPFPRGVPGSPCRRSPRSPEPRAKVKASQQGRSSEWDIHRGTALLCSLDTWVPAALGPLSSASCNLSCQVPQGWAGAQGLSCPWWHVGGEGKPLSCDGGGTLHWGHHRHLLQWCCCPLTSAALYHCVPGLPGAPSVYRC